MPNTTRLVLPYPPLTAVTADVPRDIRALAEALDNVVPIYVGALSTRPVSSPAQPGVRGRLALVTDTTPRVLYLDHGAGWDAINPALVADGPAGEATLRSLGIGPQQAISGADGRLSDERVPRDSSVTLAKAAAALRPSQGASNNAETLRAIGTATGQVLSGVPGAVGARSLADELMLMPRVAGLWHGAPDFGGGYQPILNGSAYQAIGGSWMSVNAPPVSGFTRQYRLGVLFTYFPGGSGVGGTAQVQFVGTDLVTVGWSAGPAQNQAMVFSGWFASTAVDALHDGATYFQGRSQYSPADPAGSQFYAILISLQVRYARS